ncbi:MAG TPA: hypothetical protein PLH36_11940, partial [Armatimonadota bacterium]|nr:hypothetical protein [Armatimonadota bacterium]
GGLDPRLAELETSGSTVIGVARDGVLLGWLALGDALRADAVETVERLHALLLGHLRDVDDHGVR